MSAPNETIPNAPKEQPEWGNPEVLEPQDPGSPTQPEEAPAKQPQELPDEEDTQKEIRHDNPDT